MRDRPSIRIMREGPIHGFAVYIHGQQIGGTVSVAKPIEYEDASADEYQAPALTLSQEQAEQLMADLMAAGVRPGKFSSEAIDAMGQHLQDMRQIAFRTLEIDKP